MVLFCEKIPTLWRGIAWNVLCAVMAGQFSKGNNFSTTTSFWLRQCGWIGFTIAITSAVVVFVTCRHSMSIQLVDSVVTAPLLKRASGNWLRSGIHPTANDQEGILVLRFPDCSVEPGCRYSYRVSIEWAMQLPNGGGELPDLVRTSRTSKPSPAIPIPQQ